MAIFPLWWASFSDTFGRRTIYLVAFSMFVLFSALSAVSTTIAMLIVMRLLSGGASASVHAVGAGTIADIWEVRERGRAMGMFYLGPLMGPLLAPIIGGILTQNFGWRSTMWFLTAYGGLVLVMLFLLLPETLARSKRSEGENTDGDRERECGYGEPQVVGKRQRVPLVGWSISRGRKATRFALNLQ